MRTEFKRLLMTAGLTAAFYAQAAVLVKEDFNYPAGAITNPSALANGRGWSGGWGYVGSGTNLQIVDKTWASFPGYGFAATKALTTTDANGPQFARVIDAGAVNFTVPGTYYFSLLVDNENTVNAYFSGVTNNANPSSSAEAVVQWRDGAQQDFLGTLNTTAIGDTASLARDSDYLLVGKLVVSATTGADSLSFAYFSAGQDVRTEPVWGVDANSKIGAGNFDAFNRFGLLLSGAASNNPKIGNIVIGQSYADVTAWAGGVSRVGLRPLPHGDFVAYQGSYPFVSQHVDYLQNRNDDVFVGFATRSSLHEYYVPMVPDPVDPINNPPLPAPPGVIGTDIHTNTLLAIIESEEAAGRYVHGFGICRELLQMPTQQAGPVPECTRILWEEDVAAYRQLILDAHAAGLIQRTDYKLIQLAPKSFDLTTSARAMSIVKSMDGYTVEFHNEDTPDGFPTDAIAQQTQKVANWVLAQPENLTYILHVGPIEGEYPIWRGTFNKLWAFGFPKTHERLFYNYDFIDKHEPDRRPGPETDPDTVTGNEKWLINEVKIGPDGVAPLAPAGLVAHAGYGTVSLDWSDNAESDLLSYNIYRSDNGGAYLLRQAGVPRSRYSDIGASINTAYAYEVTAVDQWGNESAPTSAVQATPRTGEILIAWHSPGTLPDTVPDVALPGVTGTLNAAWSITTSANSSSGTYGGGPAVSGTTANALRVNGQTAFKPGANQVHVTIVNNTASSIALGTFHCDYARDNAGSPKRVTLYYEGGDLANAANTWIGTNMDGDAGAPPAILAAGGFTGLQWSLSSLADCSLEPGQSATFLLEVSAWDFVDNTQFGYIDNIAITLPHANAAPVANPQSVTTPANTGISLVLSATDLDSPSLVYSILTSPSNGALSAFNANTGAVTYTPATNFSGTNRFTFAASDGILSSTGTVSVTVTPPPDPYLQWATAHGVGASAKTADDDGDGAPNLLEYALGGNPSDRADRGHAATLGVVTINGAKWLEFAHVRRSAPNSGITYTIQSGDNLATWTAAAAELVGTVPLDSEFETVTYRIPAGNSGKLFIRLLIQ